MQDDERVALAALSDEEFCVADVDKARGGTWHGWGGWAGQEPDSKALQGGTLAKASKAQT
jgi:hypothetical protein